MPTLSAPQSCFEFQKRTEEMFCKCEVGADVDGIVMGGWSGLGTAEPEGQGKKGWKKLEGQHHPTGQGKGLRGAEQAQSSRQHDYSSLPSKATENF